MGHTNGDPLTPVHSEVHSRDGKKDIKEGLTPWIGRGKAPGPTHVSGFPRNSGLGWCLLAFIEKVSFLLFPPQLCGLLSREQSNILRTLRGISSPVESDSRHSWEARPRGFKHKNLSWSLSKEGFFLDSSSLHLDKGEQGI